MTNDLTNESNAKKPGAKTRSALIVGQNANLLRALPGVLARAGFEVDAITTATRFKPAVPARCVVVAADDHELIARAAVQGSCNYDLVVIGDDRTLNKIVQSDLSDEIKLQLLPVCEAENFVHIGSKIGLSQVLAQHGILTPDFWVAPDRDALVSLLESIAHPVMIKIDRSSGGAGVFKFEPGNCVDQCVQNLTTFPVLVQRYIEGDLIDLSGFYQNGRLIHFSYSSSFEVISNPFGVSSVRIYTQLGVVDEHVFGDLRKLGKALGAHGFVNIACLRSADEGRHYFVEADMRPTVWVEHSIYVGDDPAPAIRTHFDRSTELTFPQPVHENYPNHLIVPYALRFTALELLTNRHRVWRYCKTFSRQDIVRHCFSALIQLVKQLLIVLIKPRVSAQTWQQLRVIWNRVLRKKATPKHVSSNINRR